MLSLSSRAGSTSVMSSNEYHYILLKYIHNYIHKEHITFLLVLFRGGHAVVVSGTSIVRLTCMYA